jgi:hypothetical protein
MRYRSLVPSHLTFFHTRELSSTTSLVPQEGAVFGQRRFQRVPSIWEGSVAAAFLGQFHNLGSFPVTTLQELGKEGRHMSALQHQLGTATKNGVESINSSIGRSKTAAVHIARVRGKEQGTRYLARTGETHRPYSGRAERETLIILY